MTATRRTRLPVDQRRAQLLQEAAAFFRTRPWEDILVEDIASAAGVSKASFYHYFPTKRDLYLALVRAGGDELMAATEPVMAVPAVDRLRASLHAYLVYVDEHADGYRTFLQAGIGCDDAVWQLVEHQRAVVVSRVAEGLGLREVGPTLRLALRGWVGSIEAMSLAWLDDRTIERASVVQLMERSLEASVVSALELDPSALRDA